MALAQTNQLTEVNNFKSGQLVEIVSASQFHLGYNYLIIKVNDEITKKRVEIPRLICVISFHIEVRRSLKKTMVPIRLMTFVSVGNNPKIASIMINDDYTFKAYAWDGASVAMLFKLNATYEN